MHYIRYVPSALIWPSLLHHSNKSARATCATPQDPQTVVSEPLVTQIARACYLLYLLGLDLLLVFQSC